MGVRKNLAVGVLDRLKNDVFIEEKELQKKEPQEPVLKENIKNNKSVKTISQSNKKEEITTNINISSKNKNKYEDLHTRKTYYIKNELITKMDELYENTGLNRSEIINLALIELFKRINIVDDSDTND